MILRVMGVPRIRRIVVNVSGVLAVPERGWKVSRRHRRRGICNTKHRRSVSELWDRFLFLLVKEPAIRTNGS